jgi:hypothetical protein
MNNLIKTKYYFDNGNNVDNNNFGESRTIYNLLNLIDYTNYKNEFTTIIINNNTNTNILELGCGLGIGITELCYLYNSNNYYAVNMAREDKFANGYESPKYTKDYIISFMKKYGFDMSNKKNINHYNHDLYKLSIFEDSYFDLIYSQSTIGKSHVGHNMSGLIDIILKKLKIGGISLHHVDSINYVNFDFNNRTISYGTNILKGVPIYYELYFADNKYFQSEKNIYTEVMIYIKKLPTNNIKKEIFNVSKNIDMMIQNKRNNCLKDILYYLF